MKIRTNNEKSTLNYCEALSQLCITGKLNQDPSADPNNNYEILEDILTQLYETHFPIKTVRYKKYKHKIPAGLQLKLLSLLNIKINSIGH